MRWKRERERKNKEQVLKKYKLYSDIDRCAWLLLCVCILSTERLERRRRRRNDVKNCDWNDCYCLRRRRQHTSIRVYSYSSVVWMDLTTRNHAREREIKVFGKDRFAAKQKDELGFFWVATDYQRFFLRDCFVSLSVRNCLYSVTRKTAIKRWWQIIKYIGSHTDRT